MSLRLNARVSIKWNQPRLLKREARGTERALKRIGAFVRTSARRKFLRRRKRISKPNDKRGPSVHSKHTFATLKNVLFELNSKKTAVTIGPVKFTAARRRRVVPFVTVPNILEFGGRATAFVDPDRNAKPNRGRKRRRAKFTPAQLRAMKRRRVRSVKKVITVQPRPFMRRAHKAAVADYVRKFGRLLG